MEFNVILNLLEYIYITKRKSECSEKKKLTITWEYWKQKQSNKWRWKKKFQKSISGVGYHLPFQHNELFHLPYMAVAEISLGIRLRVRPKEPFLLLKYIITLSLILVLIANSLSLVNTLSCKYNYFSSHIVVCLIITPTCVH